MTGRDEGQVPRYEIAEDALKRISDVFTEWEGSDWSHITFPARDISSIVDIARARLHMATQVRDRRRPGWLGKVVSGVYGRGFMKPGEFGKDPDPHLCFVVEVTEGVKSTLGKRVEIQAPDSEMELLAKQILSMVELRREMKAREERS